MRLANPGDIVISQIYGGGGNSGSTYKNDFIELFNRSGSPIDVTGWTVQYASTTGTSWVTTPLSGTILAGGYYLIQEQAGAGGTTNLPTVDATGAIGMSATTGKVALANIATPLSGSCPTGATVIDFVGYGTTANCFEGSGPTANLTNATAALRGSNGCTDANNNASDFTTGAANPRNSSSPVSVCGTLSPSISVTPNPVALTYNLGSGPLSQTVTVNASNLNPAAGNVTVTSSNTAVTLSNGGNFGSSVTLPYTNAGLTSTTLVAQLTSGLSAGTYSTTLVFAGGGATFNLPVNGTVVDNSAVTLIRSIQGTTHISPLNGQAVNNVQGIVTGLRNNGFYMQDPNPDSDDRTSEGIFVFQNATPTVPVGASVTVGGTVSEFRSGGSSGGNNLTTTQINTPTVTVLSTGNALPAATILGNGGRTIPTQIIEDQTGDVETSGLTFDPASDGIDFYESLEGMLVAINNPVTVSPTLSANTIWVLADNGANATGRTPRGGVAISASDFNPERILLYTGGGGSFPATSLTAINVNAGISSLTGVMDYFGGDYEVLPSTALTITPSTLTREASTLVPTANQLTVATFNVENLDPNDGATKFGNLASRIVNNLKSPDIINLEEIQDNNGATNNGTVDASTTFQTLINAITAAGGPTYSYKQIDPVNGQDGGEPGGNIRVGFLFNAARVTFIDRAGGTSTAAVTVTNVGGQPQLSFSPGRIDPTNSAFSSSRKPLVGEFVFNGQKIFVIANHFNSKGGDQGLFGKTQPPVLSSEAQRNQQATIVRNFVSSIQAIDPNASIVVAGDLNDFQFSNPLNILKGSGPTSLTTLVETLPANEQYTYNFGGNAQVIDHIMVSSGLRSRLDAYDVVHINSEFFDQDSDHDPSVARFTINGPDLSPIIRLPQANFTASGDDAVRNFIVELTEYGGQATSSGNIVITITAPLGYSLDYDNSRTTINVSGGTTNPVPVTNTNWSITSGASGSRQLSLTIKAGQAISALSTATLGFTITRTSASSASTSNLTINVNDDATKTYDGNSTNNIFVRNINAL
ncbi:endonuclease/exonuclease/phosphatase family protein [Spirosoma lituiforme]